LDAFGLSIGNGSGETGTVTVPAHCGRDPESRRRLRQRHVEISDGGKVAAIVLVAANSGSTGNLTLHSGAAIVTDT